MSVLIFNFLLWFSFSQHSIYYVKLFQTKKIKKRRTPLPLKQSRLLWKQQFVAKIRLNPDQLNTIRNNVTPSSSASSECSGSGRAPSWSSKRKRRLYKSYLNNNNNNNNDTAEIKVEITESKPEQTESGIMTRNRSRELRSGNRTVIVGRRLIGSGVYEYLVENET